MKVNEKRVIIEIEDDVFQYRRLIECLKIAADEIERFRVQKDNGYEITFNDKIHYFELTCQLKGLYEHLSIDYDRKNY